MVTGVGSASFTTTRALFAGVCKAKSESLKRINLTLKGIIAINESWLSWYALTTHFKLTESPRATPKPAKALLMAPEVNVKSLFLPLLFEGMAKSGFLKSPLGKSRSHT